jgi:hypothetical protein
MAKIKGICNTLAYKTIFYGMRENSQDGLATKKLKGKLSYPALKLSGGFFPGKAFK